MSYRFTNSDKWTDSWFSDLSANAKLLFIFLYENCDNAGVYEVNKKFMLFLLGFQEEELKNAIKEIGKAYIKSNDGTKIWLKNFLKHQKLTPLNWKNNAHKQIVMILRENLEDKDKFKGCKEIEMMLPVMREEKVIPVVEEKPKQKRTRRTTKFEKPTQQQVFEYMKEKDFVPAKVEAERFWNWFESNGWKVGKNPMKVWKGAVNTWIINWYDRNNITSKPTKMDNIRESSESLEGVDWNKVYNQETA
jgi:hypothetical protein